MRWTGNKLVSEWAAEDGLSCCKEGRKGREDVQLSTRIPSNLKMALNGRGQNPSSSSFKCQGRNGVCGWDVERAVWMRHVMGWEYHKCGRWEAAGKLEGRETRGEKVNGNDKVGWRAW